MNIKKISKRKIFLFIGDIIIIILSFNFSFFIRLGASLFHIRNFYEGISLTLLVLLIFLLSFYIFGLYNINENFGSIRFLNLVLISLFSASLISFLLFYAFPFILGRGLFLISLSLIGVQVIVWRLIFSLFFRMAVPQRNVLLIGEGKTITAINSVLEKNPDYKIVGILTTKRKKEQDFTFGLHRNGPSLVELANKHKINDIVVAVDLIRNKRLNRDIINCRLKGINVYDMPTFYEHLMDKLPVSLLKESWFFYCDGFEKLGSSIYKRSKRILDVAFSFFMLLISLPLMILIILLIKITSRGHVLYTQERLGEHMKPFKMLKFRTMVKDAEKMEPKWAEENDSRITAVGRILRKVRLDELPQFINILKGEMSLIGPRPEREYFVKRLMKEIPYYSLRFAVKPGLTGWAQVNYRYGATLEDGLEKLRYELYYIKNMSLFMDLRILLKTLRVMMFGLGR